MNVCQVRYCGTNDMLTGVAQSESKQVAGWLCLASWAPVKVKHRNRPSSDNNKALHADGLAQTHVCLHRVVNIIFNTFHIIWSHTFCIVLAFLLCHGPLTKTVRRQS